MNQRNYQRELEQIIDWCRKQSRVPRLLLHSCCAPCSSYVLEYLSQYFQITLYYYNPNIFPPEEFVKRVKEQEDLVSQITAVYPVNMVKGPYEPSEFYRMTKGLEQEPEGGARCLRCFELRLGEAAKVAAAGHYDYFTTTLTISPLKHAEHLNEIGEQMGREYGAVYLPSDFKKKNGYKRSIELSEKYGLYRQDYCGCVYSIKR